jgi:ATP-dependent Clp protease adaptor protein ClpS
MAEIGMPTIERKHKFCQSRKPEKEPRFHVLLHNDDYNTVDHVVCVLLRVLGGTFESAFQMMAEAHNTGQAIVFTGGLEQAELVKNKILGHAPCADSPADCEPTRLIASLQKAPE